MKQMITQYVPTARADSKIIRRTAAHLWSLSPPLWRVAQVTSGCLSQMNRTTQCERGWESADTAVTSAPRQVWLEFGESVAKTIRVLIALLMLSWAALAQSQTTQARIDTEQQARAIGSTLKCPICNGLSIIDSPSQFAQSMYDEVRSQVSKGQSGSQIKAFFVDRYGPSVLLDPPFSGVTLLVWLIPLGALALGALGLIAYLRRAAQPRTELTSVDPELLERIRDLSRTPR